MYTFDNNNNIFTGYIKQLLAEFNLPTYRIYGEEADRIHDRNQKLIDNLEHWFDDIEDEIVELTGLIAKYGDAEETPIGDSVAALKVRLEQLETIAVDPVDQELKETYNRLLTGEDIGIIQQSINNKRNSVKNPGDPNVHVLVFSKENVNKYKDLLKCDQLISTIYRETPATYTNKGYVDYPTKMRYIPYIKDGKIQEYVFDSATSEYKWISAHEQLGEEHKKVHGDAYGGGSFQDKLYVYNRFDRNFSTTLPPLNNEYDSDTHEYLGNYLRFKRDYFGLNLMPLYNCFSNRICPNIDLKIVVKPDSGAVDVQNKAIKDGYTAVFNTQNKNYRIYMLPVKMFRKYTIAMESPRDVEMFCGLFGKYYNDSANFSNLASSTYACYNNLSFEHPVVYTQLFDFTNWLDMNDRADLAIMENNLKLFIKVPTDLNTSIVVLEGEFSGSNAAILHGSEQNTPTNDVAYYSTANNSKIGYNYGIVNFEHIDDMVANNLDLTTQLQLLRINTGISYPFADRLIEYLTDNAITPLDALPDNIERVKTVVSANTSKDVMIIQKDGIWDSRIRYILYAYMNKDKYNINKKHDCLGYVDKDVETTYKYNTSDKKDTIASVNIYGKQWED